MMMSVGNVGVTYGVCLGTGSVEHGDSAYHMCLCDWVGVKRKGYSGGRYPENPRRRSGDIVTKGALVRYLSPGRRPSPSKRESSTLS